MPERDSPAKSTAKTAKTTARKPRAKAAAKAAPQPTEAEKTMKFVIEAARLLSDDKCEDVVVLDVRKLSQVTDFVVIGSGTSDRQMRSVLKHVEELGEQLGFRAFRVSADERAVWLLADFVHVVVHLFEPNTRAHYDLEMLWGDAERVEWERPSQKTRNRAGLRAGDGVAG
ncbi:MAG: ribosome silencing factor [Phycisphaerales bacterium]|nr:ribosome silencing factor [Phycisphaerales bacterium]